MGNIRRQPAPTTGSGTSVPTGGTTGQVLEKNSNADGDAGWSTAATSGSNTPLAASGSGSPGVDTTHFSNQDHVHPAVAAAVSIPDAVYVYTLTTLASGDQFAAGPANPSATYNSTNGWPVWYPIRVTTGGVYLLGVKVNNPGSTGSLCRLGIWNDDATRNLRPGTLLADCGTVATTSAGTISYTTTAVTLAANTRYWFGVSAQGGPTTSPGLEAWQTIPFSLGGGGWVPPANCLYQTGGVTGAFVSNPSIGGATASTVPRVYLKVQ